MNCNEVSKIFPRYLGEDLNQKEAQELEAHLESCASCKKELSAYEKSWEVLAMWEDLEPSAGFEAKFWDKAKAPGFLEWLSSLFTFRIPAWSVAILLVVAFLVGYLPHLAPSPVEKVVYVPITDEYLTRDIAVPGKMVAVLPSTGQVLNDIEKTATSDSNSDSTSDAAQNELFKKSYYLRPINMDEVFELSSL